MENCFKLFLQSFSASRIKSTKRDSDEQQLLNAIKNPFSALKIFTVFPRGAFLLMIMVAFYVFTVKWMLCAKYIMHSHIVRHHISVEIQLHECTHKQVKAKAQQEAAKIVLFFRDKITNEKSRSGKVFYYTKIGKETWGKCVCKHSGSSKVDK